MSKPGKSHQFLANKTWSIWQAARPALAAALLAAVSTAAHSAATLSAAQIVERNVAARGGLQAWHAVQSLAVSGQLDLGKPHVESTKAIELAQRGSPSVRKSLADAGLRRAGASLDATDQSDADAKPAADFKLPFALQMKRPHKTRLELEFNKQTSVQIFDGTSGWKVRPYIGRREVEALSPAELKAASAQPDLDGMLIDHAAKGIAVALEHSEVIDGRETYRLRLTLKNGEQRHVWVDAQTYLETKIDTPPRKIDGVMRTVSTYYRNYKSVNGLMVPFVVETRVDGGGNSGVMLIEHVQVNPAIDDNRFGKPVLAP
ncbi:outer membrane lipoprotein-sorting protein [Paraburkholderia sediminicola]|uniref:outer membrane lipoprotein-sorting protein n=1 Tax=Paraburkholderia sediminicola TaxID=458836 RepID=UPI0038BC1E66